MKIGKLNNQYSADGSLKNLSCFCFVLVGLILWHFDNYGRNKLCFKRTPLKYRKSTRGRLILIKTTDKD